MKTIKLIHTNDTHSYLDTSDKRAHVIQKARQTTETLVLDSGDVITGNPYFLVFKGEKEPILMNAMQYDAMTLGNHEFDNGSKFLADFLKQLQFPILASNLDVSQDNALKKVKTILPYLIKQLQGIKVGLFGLVTPTTPSSSSPSPDIIFQDPIVVAKQMVSTLRQQGVDVIVLLSHLGDDEDVELAQQVDGIDIILGAHTHKVIDIPLQIKHNTTDWVTHISQTGSYGQYVGEFTLQFNDETHLEKIAHVMHQLDAYTGTVEQMTQQITGWQKQLDKMVNHYLSETTIDLTAKRDVMKYESTNLSNLITDAYFDKAVQLGFQPDLAIMNSGGIRQSIPAGKIRLGDILKVLPFSCEFVVTQLSGQAIIDSLIYGEFPQLSHAKLTAVQLNEDEKRIEELVVLKQGVYEPIDPTKVYTVATNSFIASAKDNYVGFKGTENLVKDSIFDIDLLIEYVVTLPVPFTYDDEQRLKVSEHDS